MVGTNPCFIQIKDEHVNINYIISFKMNCKKLTIMTGSDDLVFTFNTEEETILNYEKLMKYTIEPKKVKKKLDIPEK